MSWQTGNSGLSTDDRTEWMLQREVFHGLSKLWGPFETDLFASRLNKQVDDYMLHGNLTLRQGPLMHFLFVGTNIFMPFHLLLLSTDACKKITQEEAEGVIIVPMWSTQTYCPRLLSMVIKPPRRLPMKENLLTLPHSQMSHTLWKKMQLIACLVSGKVSKQKEFRQKLEKSCFSQGESQQDTNMMYTLGNGCCSVVKGALIPTTHL